MFKVVFHHGQKSFFERYYCEKFEVLITKGLSIITINVQKMTDKTDGHHQNT